MKVARCVAACALIVALTACVRESYVPAARSAPSIQTRANVYFKTFSFGGAIVTAIAPGLNGTLWFSACQPASCRIGYFDSTLNQTFIAGTYLSVHDLALGPDGNMWFDQGQVRKRGYYLGRIDTSGHVKKIRLGGSQTSIVGGPDGRMWFDDSGIVASVQTDGTGLQKITAALLGGPDIPLVFGPDKRLYLTLDKDRNEHPICALTTKTERLRCFPIPSGYFDGAAPLLWVGKVLLASGGSAYPVYAMSPTGRKWKLQNGRAFYPEALAPNGHLAGTDSAYGGSALKLAQLTSTGFKLGKAFTLPSISSSSSRGCASSIGHVVTTSEGYIWVQLDQSDCLERFEVKQ